MSPSSFTVLICFLSLSKASSVIYGKVGGKVVLDPGPSAKLIETITWKHGEDIAVESYGGKVFAYRHFNGCTALNMSTGALTISSLNRNHSGSYTAEINNVVTKSMEVRVLLPVPKPVVSMRCDADHVVCTLTCKGNTTGAEPVTYSWSIFDVTNYERGPELNITKENPDPWFRCDLENDVSSASSEKINNPFKGRNHWLIIGLSVACVVLLIGIFLVWFIRKRRKEQYDVGTVEERKEMLGDPNNGGDTFLSVQETAQQNHMSSVVPVVDNETETINESSDRDKPSKESSDEPETPAERQEEAPAEAPESSDHTEIPAERQEEAPAEGPESSDHTEIPAERQEEAPVQVHRPAEGPESSNQTETPAERQVEAPAEGPESSDHTETPAERQEEAPAEGPESSDHTEIPAEHQVEAPVQVHRPAEGPESSDHTATTEVQQTESSSEAGASAEEQQTSSDDLKAASSAVSCNGTEKSAEKSAGEETNGNVSTSVVAP